MIKAGQIYFIRSIDLGKVKYGRPCLVLQTSAHGARVCYFSTKLNLNVEPQVIIEKGDLDFPATGLSDTSCIMNHPIDDVPLEFFNGAKLRGCATGEFKKKVEEWYGAPLI